MALLSRSHHTRLSAWSRALVCEWSISNSSDGRLQPAARQAVYPGRELSALSDQWTNQAAHRRELQSPSPAHLATGLPLGPANAILASTGLPKRTGAHKFCKMWRTWMLPYSDAEVLQDLKQQSRKGARAMGACSSSKSARLCISGVQRLLRCDGGRPQNRA